LEKGGGGKPNVLHKVPKKPENIVFEKMSEVQKISQGIFVETKVNAHGILFLKTSDFDLEYLALIKDPLNLVLFKELYNMFCLFSIRCKCCRGFS
jgi:hypothetical protein